MHSAGCGSATGEREAPGRRPVFLSVVIPVKDEEDNVGRLAAEIDEAFSGARYAWETVWVDDGSTDSTLAEMKRLPAPHRYLKLDRNCGQSAALAAGIGAAQGEWIGTLDGDGQNDPADLPRQLEHALRTGVDVVNGVRARRRDSVVRRLSSKIANGFRNRMLGEDVTDVGCSTRVARREAVSGIPFFHGMHRFLPTLVCMRGFTMSEIPVNHRPRTAGRSKYGIGNRLWSGLRDVFGVRWLKSRARRWKVVEFGGIREGEVPDV